MSSLDRLEAVGRDLFAELTSDRDLTVTVLDDELGICLLHPTRGGGKIFVAPDESVLFAASSLDFETALDAFRQGRRTDRDLFRSPLG